MGSLWALDTPVEWSVIDTQWCYIYVMLYDAIGAALQLKFMARIDTSAGKSWVCVHAIGHRIH